VVAEKEAEEPVVVEKEGGEPVVADKEAEEPGVFPKLSARTFFRTKVHLACLFEGGLGSGEG